MSILEAIGSVAETPSPSASVRPRSRLRSSTRISSRYQDGMRDADDNHNDTDESTPPSASNANARRRSHRVKPIRLSMRDSSAEEEEEEEEEEEDDDNTTVDQEDARQEEIDDDDDDEEEEEEHQSRYAFRERGSVKKPARFDQGIYDEVFNPYGNAPSSSASRSTRRRSDGGRRRDDKASRRGLTSSSRRGRKRRRREEEEDDDDNDEVDELDYATDESDMEMIQRRIDEQERVEAAEAAAAVAAVQALESAPRHTRSTRYALRHRDAKESLSPEPTRERNDSSNSHRRRARRDQERRNTVELHQDEGEEEEEQHEELTGNDGSRYYLRQRSHSDLHDHEEERNSMQSSRTSRRNAARNQRLEARREERRNERRERDREREERDRRRRAREEARAMERDEATAAAFAAEENGPRYSLRDRSKVQRSEPALTKDHSLSAYADFAKRQSSRGSSQRGSGHSAFHSSGADRRANKRSHKRRIERRRRLSSSSSSSSSDDMFKYYDSDQGGMRTGGGKRKSSGHGGHKRADISPIEIDRSITWDSVGGLEKHIEALKEMVMLPLLYPEFYEKYNITPPSGVLFYGPPGTGKTLLARALANSCTIEDNSPALKISLDASEVIDTKKPRNVTFYMRKGADCLSKWVGEAERQLRLLFEEAKRNQPSIIFFDEIDGLAPVRSAKQDQIHASIVSTLLALMDGMDARGRVVVIGATNRLDAIDPALRRPGRFDRELGFKLPNVLERKKMLEIHTKKWNPPLSETFVQEIAQRTVGYCGADVKALCAEAALCSLRRVYPQVYGSQDKLLIQLDKIVVSRGDFTKAMKKITPASHRTTSSFASPLPKGVKLLLDGSLSSILRKIADQFPLFPLDAQAVDALYKSDGGSAPARAISPDGVDEDENEDADIYAVMNHDDCDVCHGDEGELLCCDACPGAFHRSCLPSDHSGPSEHSTDWFCPECKDTEKMDAFLEAKQQKAQQRQARQMYLLPQLVGFPRVLICGQSGMGQEYVAAALLHVMEGLTHFSLDYPSLVADVNTHNAEEALIHRLNEAQKCLPCVIYLPQIDLWWENTPQSMQVALKMMLMNMQIKANLPVLFLATTSSSDLNDLPESLLDLYKHDRTVQRSTVIWQLRSISEQSRKIHFEQAFAAMGATPLPRRKRRRGDEKLEVLPLAPVVKKPKREPTVAELERIREHDLHCLRELRIFLGQVLDYCAGQRTYSPFHHPVDADAVPDYYLIIKSPMDLSTMRERLNDGDYTCFEQFLDDIQLIVRNANMFNPKRSATRHIAQAAGTMKDNILSFAHRFRKHQGYDLFSKCREITKRLHTNPAMYNEASDIAQPHRASSKSAPVKQPSRISDRLRGIQAAEPIAEDVSSSKKREDHKVSRSADVRVGANGEEGEAPQWFGSKSEPTTSSVSDQDASAIVNDDANETESVETADMNATADDQVFEEGDTVFVMARTFPGMNKLGGVGKVVRRNEDGTYYVKYILGGSEKSVEPMFVRDNTEEAVKESVRNQRSNHHASSTGNALASVDKAPVKTSAEIQAEFFDNLVWPILADDGWTREEMMDVSDDGTTSVVMRYVSSVLNDAETVVALEGVDQVLEYINKDRSLSVKCFGKRFAEELPTESVFGDANAEACPESSEKVIDLLDDEGKDPTPESKATEPSTDDTPLAQLSVPASEPATEDIEVDVSEEPHEFVYDETRMANALNNLVKKTAGWTVGELRDELLLLNKLAYPFRYDFDRSKLMQDVEDHIASLSR